MKKLVSLLLKIKSKKSVTNISLGMNATGLEPTTT